MSEPKEKKIITGTVKKSPVMLLLFAVLAFISFYIAFDVTIDEAVYVFVGIGILFVIVDIVVYLYCKDCVIIVTDKRVYGCATFGKRVDLPIDSVSSVGLCQPCGIAVGSSSGAIKFVMIENRHAVHKAISNLLLERQRSGKVWQEKPSVTNELKKYKELLDGGVISQEEFDAKKKQLLGL